MGIPTPRSGDEEHARIPQTADEHSRHEYSNDDDEPRRSENGEYLAGDRSPRAVADDEPTAHGPGADDEPTAHGPGADGLRARGAGADDELVARSPRSDDEYAAAVPGAVTAPQGERDAPYRDPYAGTGGGDMPSEPGPEASDEVPAHAAPEDVVLFDQDPDQVQARWRDLQASFVDDPGEAVRRADGLVGEVVEALTSSLTSRTDGLRDRWKDAKDAESADTEQLRLALRDYRSVLESLLTLSERR
ncbi:hypothetical protein [Nonomuraea sp. B19D2]|uniref:hypothetical protein n=1 Tax=Nonomuraea sp. B19D2 TaxID=3159561 RepID=UPI0032DADF3C